ncbi:MAG: hypothetical protein ACLPYS_16635 [Vulcanimicrobiaceae bacterium]
MTDEILGLHDRLIGSFFVRAKRKFGKRFVDDGKALNDKVRLYARVGSALIAAKEAGSDPYRAIEAVLPWDRFAQSVQEAEQLARDEEFDSIALLAERFGQLRRYSPAFLETFEFHAAPASREILDAIAVLREMNRTDARKVPGNAPTGFIRERWREFVFSDGGGIDRRFYELAVMSELKNGLWAATSPSWSAASSRTSKSTCCQGPSSTASTPKVVWNFRSRPRPAPTWKANWRACDRSLT